MRPGALPSNGPRTASGRRPRGRGRPGTAFGAALGAAAVGRLAAEAAPTSVSSSAPKETAPARRRRAPSSSDPRAAHPGSLPPGAARAGAAERTEARARRAREGRADDRAAAARAREHRRDVRALVSRRGLEQDGPALSRRPLFGPPNASALEDRPDRTEGTARTERSGAPEPSRGRRGPTGTARPAAAERLRGPPPDARSDRSRDRIQWIALALDAPGLERARLEVLLHGSSVTVHLRGLPTWLEGRISAGRPALEDALTARALELRGFTPRPPSDRGPRAGSDDRPMADPARDR